MHGMAVFSEDIQRRENKRILPEKVRRATGKGNKKIIPLRERKQ